MAVINCPKQYILMTGPHLTAVPSEQKKTWLIEQILFTCHQFQLLPWVTFGVELRVAAVANLTNEARWKCHQVSPNQDTRTILQ